MKIVNIFLVALLLTSVSSVFSGDKKKSMKYTQYVPYVDKASFTPKKVDLSGVKKVSSSPGVSVVGGLANTYYDFQTNGGDEHRVHVLPDGSVHVVYMGGTNRAAIGDASRGSFYAFSDDFGETFTNLGRVEFERAGFPSLGVTSEGYALIVSHTGAVLGTSLFVDALPGLGIFTSYDAPRAPIECIWPRAAVSTNNRVIFYGSSGGTDVPGNTWNALDLGTSSFAFSENQPLFPDVGNEIRGSIAASAGGKVALVLINGLDPPPVADFGNNNIILRESTDGGLTFGDPVNVTGYSADTSSVHEAFWLGISAIYVGEELHIVWNEVLDQVPGDAGISYFGPDLRIKHWAASVNGGVPTTAARWDSVHFSINQTEGVNHLPLDYPSIGVDENGILTVVFTGFSGDTLNADPVSGYAYGDIWAVSSANNGLLWGEPTNLTNSVDMDDRYPYISSWNESGKINVMYMSDSVAGSFAFTDGAPVSTPDFLFLKVDHPSTEPYDFYATAVEDKTPAVPERFSLEQNYPNPFNPSTNIAFTLAKAENAKLEIFNTIGQRVATLVNGKLPAGQHNITWDAKDMPSGIYFYKLEAGTFSQVKKMILAK